jgi:taurine-pyruvate aminotransferase
VGDIRGKGLLMGVELVADRETKQPLDGGKVGGIVAHCQQNGVLIGRNGNTVPGRSNVLIMAPPLVLQEVDADRMVEALQNAMNQALN